MTLPVQQSQSSPRPERRVRWLWQAEPHGYGELRISTLTPTGWHRQHYFARPLKGRMGRVWELSEVVDGAEVECVVNLVGWLCNCAEFFRDNDCLHVRALASLDHHGRL
jgi:hypothetical protein